MPSEFSAGEIADVDQWLASLDVMIEEPLQNLRKMIATTNGDKSIAHMRIARSIMQKLKFGDDDFKVAIGMGYAAMLILIDKRKDAGK